MATARIELAEITNWDSFHQVCAKVLGFPDFYGKNMDAFIDCLSYLRGDDGMSGFVLANDECLDLEINGTESFNQRLPDIMDALLECVAFVNQRYLEVGEQPAIRLVLL